MRVAVAQFTASRDKAANRDRLADLIGAAAGAGADLIVAPEAAMHPFGRPERSLATVAEPLDGPFVAGLCAAAHSTGSTVLAGMFEAVPADDHVFNTVVVVDRTGLRGCYRKVHLFDAFGWRESDRLRAGAADQLLVVPIAGLSVGVLTCYDLRFPEICRALVDRGSTLLAVPAAWVAGPLKEDHWLTLSRARAIENTCYLAAAGQGPPDYAGRSVVVDPMGVILAQRGETDGVAVADVDPARVGQVRGTLPCLRHRRYDVVARAVPADD